MASAGGLQGISTQQVHQTRHGMQVRASTSERGGAEWTGHSLLRQYQGKFILLSILGSLLFKRPKINRNYDYLSVHSYIWCIAFVPFMSSPAFKRLCFLETLNNAPSGTCRNRSVGIMFYENALIFRVLWCYPQDLLLVDLLIYRVLGKLISIF